MSSGSGREGAYGRVRRRCGYCGQDAGPRRQSGSMPSCHLTADSIERRSRTARRTGRMRRAGRRACDSREACFHPSFQLHRGATQAEPRQPRFLSGRVPPEYGLASADRSARPLASTRPIETRSRPAGQRPPDYPARLSLAVRGVVVCRKPLEILLGGWLSSPLSVQLSHRGNWRFNRHAALAGRHNLVLPPVDFHDLADRQIELLNRSRHIAILNGWPTGGRGRAESAGNAENPTAARQAQASLLDPYLGVALSAMHPPLWSIPLSFAFRTCFTMKDSPSER
jgi:hypothetical protein